MIKISCTLVVVLTTICLTGSVTSERIPNNRLVERSNRPIRQANADQMVQNILRWLQGVYTQQSRRSRFAAEGYHLAIPHINPNLDGDAFRQGTLKEYLPPSNTQKPRPFMPPGDGTDESGNFVDTGYPPAGSITPEPPFPIYTNPPAETEAPAGKPSGPGAVTEMPGFPTAPPSGYPEGPVITEQSSIPAISTETPIIPAESEITTHSSYVPSEATEYPAGPGYSEQPAETTKAPEISPETPAYPTQKAVTTENPTKMLEISSETYTDITSISLETTETSKETSAPSEHMGTEESETTPKEEIIIISEKPATEESITAITSTSELPGYSYPVPSVITEEPDTIPSITTQGTIIEEPEMTEGSIIEPKTSQITTEAEEIISESTTKSSGIPEGPEPTSEISEVTPETEPGIPEGSTKEPETSQISTESAEDTSERVAETSELPGTSTESSEVTPNVSEETSEVSVISSEGPEITSGMPEITPGTGPIAGVSTVEPETAQMSTETSEITTSVFEKTSGIPGISDITPETGPEMPESSTSEPAPEEVTESGYNYPVPSITPEEPGSVVPDTTGATTEESGIPEGSTKEQETPEVSPNVSEVTSEVPGISEVAPETSPEIPESSTKESVPVPGVTPEEPASVLPDTTGATSEESEIPEGSTKEQETPEVTPNVSEVTSEVPGISEVTPETSPEMPESSTKEPATMEMTESGYPVSSFSPEVPDIVLPDTTGATTEESEIPEGSTKEPETSEATPNVSEETSVGPGISEVTPETNSEIPESSTKEPAPAEVTETGYYYPVPSVTSEEPGSVDTTGPTTEESEITEGSTKESETPEITGISTAGPEAVTKVSETTSELTTGIAEVTSAEMSEDTTKISGGPEVTTEGAKSTREPEVSKIPESSPEGPEVTTEIMEGTSKIYSETSEGTVAPVVTTMTEFLSVGPGDMPEVTSEMTEITQEIPGITTEISKATKETEGDATLATPFTSSETIASVETSVVTSMDKVTPEIPMTETATQSISVSPKNTEITPLPEVPSTEPSEQPEPISPSEETPAPETGGETSAAPTEKTEPAEPEPTGTSTEEDLRHPPHIHNIDVQCAKDMMTINIEFNRVFDGEIYSKGYYNMPECRYVQSKSGQIKYTFTVNLNMCGTEFVNAFDTQGQSYLENVLVLQNEAGVQEIWDTVRSVRCLWEGNLKEQLSASLMVGMLTQEIVTFSGDTAMAKLDILLGRGPFGQPANGLVKIGEPMTLVVSVSGDPGFDIQVKDCRATDSTGANIIQLTDDNGCILKPKLFGAFQKTRNTGDSGASIIAYAYFNAFKFPDVMDLMVECNIELCKTDCEMCSNGNEQLEPGRRRRRDISSENVTLHDGVSMGKHIRVVLAEDLATASLFNEGLCMSTPSFIISSSLLISLLTASCLFSAYMWLKAQRIRFKY